MYIAGMTSLGQPANVTTDPAGRSWLQSAAEAGFVRALLTQGIRDAGDLTNRIFFLRHPERQGRKLDRQEPDFAQLAEEWIAIRDQVVRPLVNVSGESSAKATVQSQPGAGPTGPLGVLTISGSKWPSFTYSFTPEDVLWTARFLTGEAGGRDDLNNQAIIWAMFNRYALFTHSKYKTFHRFLRAYSTPLQPVLNSWRAAQRHMDKGSFVKTGGFYKAPHDDIPKGQLRQFLQLQERPWSKLPPGARSLAERALAGHVTNPIGNASEFDNTFVYFQDNNKGRAPSEAQWVQYTKDFARIKKLQWVGPVPGLNQKVNAFFVEQSVANLPPGTVRVIRSG